MSAALGIDDRFKILVFAMIGLAYSQAAPVGEHLAGSFGLTRHSVVAGQPITQGVTILLNGAVLGAGNASVVTPATRATCVAAEITDCPACHPGLLRRKRSLRRRPGANATGLVASPNASTVKAFNQRGYAIGFNSAIDSLIRAMPNG